MDGGFLIAATPVAVAAPAQTQAAIEIATDAGFQDALNRSVAALTPPNAPMAGAPAPALPPTVLTAPSAALQLAPLVAPVAAMPVPAPLAGANPTAGEEPKAEAAPAPQPAAEPDLATIRQAPSQPAATPLAGASALPLAETPEPGPATNSAAAALASPKTSPPGPWTAAAPAAAAMPPAEPDKLAEAEDRAASTVATAIPPSPDESEPGLLGEERDAEQKQPEGNIPMPTGPSQLVPMAAALPPAIPPSPPDQPSHAASTPAPPASALALASPVAVPVIQPTLQQIRPSPPDMPSEAAAETEISDEVDVWASPAPNSSPGAAPAGAPSRSARDDAFATFDPMPAEARPAASPGFITSWGFETAPARLVEAAPPASGPAPAPMRQVAPIAIALAFTPGAANGFQLSLDPVELGRVEIRVQREGDTHSVRVVAERPETLALLLRDRHELDRSLADAGLRVEAKGIEFALGPQSGTSDQRQQGEARPGAAHRGGTRAAPQPDADPRPARALRGLLDLNI